jgi:hypothetical protein
VKFAARVDGLAFDLASCGAPRIAHCALEQLADDLAAAAVALSSPDVL